MEKHSRNYLIEGHTDQFVEREQLEIYYKKKKKNERWGGWNLLVTIKLPYNSSIWEVWVNGEKHDRVRDRVEPKFKEMLNKYQLINQKNKKQKKWWYENLQLAHTSPTWWFAWGLDIV